MVIALLAACGGPRHVSRYQMVHLYGPPVVPAEAYEHYIEGKRASLSGDHQRAIAHFKLASHAAPDQPELPVAIALELLRAGRLEDAERTLDETIDRFEDDAAAWRVRGRVKLARDRAGPAAEDLARAVRLAPRHRPGYLLWATALALGGHTDEAWNVTRMLAPRVPRAARTCDATFDAARARLGERCAKSRGMKRTRLAALCVTGVLALGCGRKPSPEECAAAFDHMITLMKAEETTAAHAGMMQGRRTAIVKDCEKGSKKELACIMESGTFDEAMTCGGRPSPAGEQAPEEAEEATTAPEEAEEAP